MDFDHPRCFSSFGEALSVGDGKLVINCPFLLSSIFYFSRITLDCKCLRFHAFSSISYLFTAYRVSSCQIVHF